MKKFILHLSVFFIVCLILYAGAITIISVYGPSFLKKNLRYERGAYGHMYTRLAEAEKIGEVDVLVVGSSHAYRGFDTRIFQRAGMRAFNLGSSSQSPIQTRYLLERYLERLNPKIVVWEVFPLTFAGDGYESMVDLASNQRHPWTLLPMTMEINQIPAYNTYIIACMRSLFNIGSDYSEKVKKGRDTYVAGGYVASVTDPFDNSTAFKSAERILALHQIRAFEQALKILKACNVKVLIVQAPYTKAYGMSISNKIDIDRYFRSCVDQGLAVRYENYNNLNLSLVDSVHFYDAHHLNQAGVEIFNNAFLQTLPMALQGVTVQQEKR